MTAGSPASALVRLDDPELARWVRDLPDEELSTGLRTVLTRASQVLAVLDLMSFDEIERMADNGAVIGEVYDEVRRRVAPVREASDELSQAFVTLGHIDIHSGPDSRPAEIEPGIFYDAHQLPDEEPEIRTQIVSALNASRRLLGREWRTLKARLADENIRSSSTILLTFCHAHLDRVRTLVEYIAPALFAVLAPPEIEVEAAEVEASLAIRNHVVDFQRTCTRVQTHLAEQPATEWPPYLEQAQESLDRLLFGIAFTWLRDTDQRMLTDCRELLDQSLAMWTPLRAEPMKMVISTMARVGESLLRINDRPSLVAHDVRELETIRSLLTTVTEHPGELEGRSAQASILIRLDRLYGRDAGIDHLARDGLAIGEELDVFAIRERVHELLESLHGQML